MPRTSRAARHLLAAVLASSTVLAGVAGAQVVTGDVAHDAGLQWGLDLIDAPDAWDRATGRGTVIAVIDSGASLDHEDLRSKVDPGVACRNTAGDPGRCSGSAVDDDGHGSHVAGIAAAATGNGSGVAGVAPDARILPVKVLFKPCPACQATGNAGDVSAGIRWATDQGADVINLSLGSTTSSVFGPEFVDAIRYAWDRGAIPVVAAGNQFVLTADFGGSPAVVVSATDRDDGAPSYSNGVGRAQWAVAAPGGEAGDTAETCSQGGRPVGILSTYWAEGDEAAYACLSGTSMAAPHVAGALAVLLSDGADPAAAIDALLATAVDLGPPGRDELFGNGRVDLDAAVTRIAATPLSSPSSVAPTSTSPTSAPTTTVPDMPDPPPTTTPVTAVLPDPPPDPSGETSAPQPFVPDEDPTPVLPAVVAALAIAIVGSAGFSLRRRGRV